MTSKNLKSAIWLILAVSATALAAGGPPPGKGGGGGEEDTGSFKLSVPAVMIGSAAGGATCGTGDWSILVPPSGDPKSGFPISPLDYYYVQGVNPWQAECVLFPTSPLGRNVTGAWGDNLVGDAKLKVGSPIRVELLLWDASTELHQGYEVVKLDPSALDRVAPYGVLATGTSGSYAAEAKYMTPVVHDAGASMTITGAGFSVSENPITPEINATGKVVYGYNLRVPAAGEYVITFKMPNVNFLTCDAGVCAADTATLKITVGTGGGGGGGKKGGGRP
jgi:hypothetical protein